MPASPSPKFMQSLSLILKVIFYPLVSVSEFPVGRSSRFLILPQKQSSGQENVFVHV